MQYRSPGKLLLVLACLALATAAAGYAASGAGTALRWGLECCLMLGTMCVAYRALDANRLGEALTTDAEAGSAGSRLWTAAGFVGVVAALLWLERANPYYFTQDDNLAQNLPSILYGCRSAFAGVFPEWNPHQYMGSPCASLGYYALTYPVTYFCYWLARDLLHDVNATLELFAFVHLLGGYVAACLVARREGCRPSLAMLAGLCWSLSGFALVFSRSSFQHSAIVLWTPVLMLCAQRLRDSDVGWRWILILGAAIGISFHSGHVQMWAYSVLLVDVAIAWLMMTGAVPLRRLWACAAAHFVGVALAAPLLVAQLAMTRNVTRYLNNIGMAANLLNLLVPTAIFQSEHPLHWVPGTHVTEMCFAGGVFAATSALLAVSLLCSHWTRRALQQNVWLICALLSFLLALGDRGVLWTLMSYLPGFGGFRFPWKFIGCLSLFTIVAGAAATERLLRACRWRMSAELPLAALVCWLLVWHCTLTDQAFYNYGFAPFPKGDPQLLARVAPADGSAPKVLPICVQSGLEFFSDAGLRSHDPQFYDSLANEWATQQGAYSIDGYDPLVVDGPAPLQMIRNLFSRRNQALDEYGVRYLLQFQSPGTVVDERKRQPWPGGHTIYRHGSVELIEMPTPHPMAFAAAEPATALPVRFDGGGAWIDTASLPQGGAVVLNLLWRKEYHARAGALALPTHADSWGRIEVPLPPHTAQLRIAFRAPWRQGALLSVIALAAAALLGWLAAAKSSA